MSLIEIKSAASLAKHTEEITKSVLLFGADWHEACPMLKMVLGALAAAPDNVGILFGEVDAESVSDLSDKFDITMVPTILLLVGNSNTDNYTVKERLEGEVLSDPSHVTLAVQRLANLQVAKDGSSGAAAAATAENNASEKGEGGNTTNTNEEDPKKAALNDRLERLIRADAIMLFMKGTPSKPKCGFSRQAIDVLRKEEIPFGSFDILSDNDVRQGLKVFSDWPTYPQIYVKGELMGGLDILKETAAEGSLKDDWEIADLLANNSNLASQDTEDSLDDRLGKLVNRHTVMLFMKGLPSNPQCGFSRQIVDILDETGVSYDAFNIFEDDEVRQGLKEFSDWPTYPQLYYKGELLGGLDIVRELKESGELEEMLQEE